MINDKEKVKTYTYKNEQGEIYYKHKFNYREKLKKTVPFKQCN